ncbi:MAG: hypothetical protein KHW62_02775 [Clostridiales bacterium]|nr:hypothetical protein [Clostridiales bacterium]
MKEKRRVFFLSDKRKKRKNGKLLFLSDGRQVTGERRKRRVNFFFFRINDGKENDKFFANE